jgi:DNA-binding transcriptional MerR regulator
MWGVEPPIEHRDVTTIMRLLSDIQVDVREIRELLEENEDGKEETLENDG